MLLTAPYMLNYLKFNNVPVIECILICFWKKGISDRIIIISEEEIFISYNI